MSLSYVYQKVSQFVVLYFLAYLHIAVAFKTVEVDEVLSGCQSFQLVKNYPCVWFVTSAKHQRGLVRTWPLTHK
jgi:hypothetical protein